MICVFIIVVIALCGIVYGTIALLNQNSPDCSQNPVKEYFKNSLDDAFRKMGGKA